MASALLVMSSSVRRSVMGVTVRAYVGVCGAPWRWKLLVSKLRRVWPWRSGMLLMVMRARWSSIPISLAVL